MGCLGMKRQDLVELYQLCRMYSQTYGGAGAEAAERLMREAGAQYRESCGKGDIAAESNPRGAGRKRVYGEETNRRIQELHKEGLSKRKIAKGVGCSLGHVQDVTRAIE